jgi:hypothetical protein
VSHGTFGKSDVGEFDSRAISIDLLINSIKDDVRHWHIARRSPTSINE